MAHGQNDGTAIREVSNENTSALGDPILDSDTISILSHWAFQLEQHMQTPCDVEWCLDRSGRIHLLQCRPLYQQPHPPVLLDADDRPSDTATETTVLFKGGICACSGMGSGPIHKISNGDDLRTVPDHCVALLTTAPPHYVPILDRVNAVIIEHGSIAGHFQAVAREFNIPTLVHAENAGRILHQGEPVTVNTDKCEVVASAVSHPSLTAARKRASIDDLNPLQRRLAAAMDFISPLKLVDPHAPTFTPQSCRSMHDILRFAHEKAIYEMFSIGDRRMKRKSGARRLIGDLPMVIYVLDVGGGIQKAKARNQTVRIDDLKCQPMHALWKGLLHPDIQWAGHHHFDWADYDRMVMDGGIIGPDSAIFASYAVVADRYLNFCLKFGYHFAIIDTLYQAPPNSGHIWFRFTGGGADTRGRMLRVQFTKTILSKLGFSVKTEGDLINARLGGCDAPMIAERLERIGHLLGVTRLMDMHLQSESEVDRLVNSFLNDKFTDFVWDSEEEKPDER
jgi:pyruvate,water dikinase